MRLDRLSVPGCDVVVDVSTGVPAMVHWGAPLGDAALDTVASGAAPPVPGGPRQPPSLSIVPEHGSGHVGSARAARASAPRHGLGATLRSRTRSSTGSTDDGGGRRPIAELELPPRSPSTRCCWRRAPSRNLSADRYLLQTLAVTLPVPRPRQRTAHLPRAVDPRVPRRTAPVDDRHVARARTGPVARRTNARRWCSPASPGSASGTARCGALHLAWSGNHCVVAELLPDGRRCLQLGELLHPGELALEPGESYRTPTVVGAYSRARPDARRPNGSTGSPGAAGPSRRGRGRCCSTRGRPSTSTTTPTG